MFRFKQFSVDQTGCAMKINTDGVLLGALAQANEPQNILDIGTGTGVITLMLAQRFPSAQIDAVEIDITAAQTAGRNFENSPFAERLNVYPLAIKDFFSAYPERKYDLIVSNPPFHINSLESPKEKTTLAKHADESFFEDLTVSIASRLTGIGSCWLILPSQAANLIKELTAEHKLYLQQVITLHSFKDDDPHREILVVGKTEVEPKGAKFVIYDEPKVYSEMYIDLLRDFFTIF